MPIKILVDGYNLLGALRGMGGPLEANREALVRLLASYAARRPHEVTVVFDAMHEGGLMEARDRRGPVTLVYTRGARRPMTGSSGWSRRAGPPLGSSSRATGRSPRRRRGWAPTLWARERSPSGSPNR